MFRHCGNSLSEVVFLLFVDVMRKQQRVVIEHHEVSTDANARRQAKLTAAGPATIVDVTARVGDVVKVLGVTVSAIDDRISQTDHHCAPVALAHATMLRVSGSFGE